jgi:peptidyl-prolyl cis-trans isomerase D
MIYIFRKEIKKWHAVLWVIFVSLALSGVGIMFLRSSRMEDVVVATVDGNDISLKKYQQALVPVEQSFSMFKKYAKMLGLSESIFLKQFGNPHETALENCIKDTILDTVKSSLNIKMATDYIKEEIIKTIPKELLSSDGKINIDSYQNYLQRLFQTPSEYEDAKEEEFKRRFVEEFISNTYYVPNFFIKNRIETNNGEKSFNIVTFLFDDFYKKIKKPENSELKEFFKYQKEQYRIEEQRKAEYWKISAKEYSKKITINEKTIETFYNKNKSTLFRIAPQVNVKHIFFSFHSKKEGSTSKEDIFALAKKIHTKVKEKPESFSDFVQEYSDNENTKKNGGLTGFFKKGTEGYDPEFEIAAFRLQKKGEISDVISTKKGYEILQLEERNKSTEKPLNVVRDEIVNTLLEKRALTMLKSDLESVLRKEKSDPKSLSQFIEKHKLEKHGSNFLKKSTVGQDKFDSALSQKLFSIQKNHPNYGYFLYDDAHIIIFKQTDIKPSYIQKYETITEKVLNDYNKIKTQEMMSGLMKQIKLSVLQKDKTLQQAAIENKLPYIQTELIKKSDSLKGFESKNLKQAIFALSDISQLLSYKDKENRYLAQLKDSKAPDKTEFEQEKDRFTKQNKEKNGRSHISNFVASLQRFLQKQEKIVVHTKPSQLTKKRYY